MSALSLIASEIKILGSDLARVDTNTDQENFQLDGSTDHIYLPDVDGFDSSDRLVVVFVGHRTSGTTSKVTYNVWDAEDDDGSPDTFKLAQGSGGYSGNDTSVTVTDTADDEDLQSAATGHHAVIVGVKLQSDRPWLRCSIDLDDGTDVFTSSCLLLAIPAGL